MDKLKITNSCNQTLIGYVSVAENILTRTKGLLGTSCLPAYQGLLIRPCKQVHTLGMCYPISVWFINKENRIIRIIDNLPSYRISPLVNNSLMVLEFPERWAYFTGSSEGDTIVISKTKISI